MTSPNTVETFRGKQPVASPMVRWITIIIGVLFLVLAGLSAREMWVRYTDTSMRSYARPFTHYIGSMTYEPWMFYAGILCCLLALFLLWFVFKPRFKSHRQLVDNNQSVWMRPIDIARMTSAGAKKIPGVTEAQTVVRSDTVHLTISGDSDDPTLMDRVARTVGPLVSQVSGSPQLKITIDNPEEDQ